MHCLIRFWSVEFCNQCIKDFHSLRPRWIDHQDRVPESTLTSVRRPVPTSVDSDIHLLGEGYTDSRSSESRNDQQLSLTLELNTERGVPTNRRMYRQPKGVISIRFSLSDFDVTENTELEQYFVGMKVEQDK